MIKDIVIGTHSIEWAIKNPLRENKELIATDEGWKTFKKQSQLSSDVLNSLPIKIHSTNSFQNEMKKLFQQSDFHYSRIPGGISLLADAYRGHSIRDLYDSKSEKKNLLALDQITDINNIAAIMRTAAFFKLDGVVMSSKSDKPFPPSFYRISSGAAETVPIYRTSNLSRTLTKLQENGVELVGLAEESEDSFQGHLEALKNKSICLVMGAEDHGLSHAVRRSLSKTFSLKAAGEIKSLNVSVATAICLEKILSC